MVFVTIRGPKYRIASQIRDGLTPMFQESMPHDIVPIRNISPRWQRPVFCAHLETSI
jgi:hypothetical protein